MLPIFWKAMLFLQDFSDSISFLFTPGPTIYQRSSLIWTLKFKYTACRDLKNFPKIQGPLRYNSCEAHQQNYMYAGQDQYRSIDRGISISGEWSSTDPRKLDSTWRCYQKNQSEIKESQNTVVLDPLLLANTPFKPVPSSQYRFKTVLFKLYIYLSSLEI